MYSSVTPAMTARRLGKSLLNQRPRGAEDKEPGDYAVLSDIELEIFLLLTKVEKLFKQGNYTEAVGLAKRAVELSSHHLGEKHSFLGDSLNNLALVHFAMGDYGIAEKLLREAMEIRRKASGEKHSSYAQSLNNLAELIAVRGDYSAAEPLYRQALEIWRETLGDDHPEVATAMNNLANLYRAVGNYAAALPLHEQALEIWRNKLGEEHPDVAASMIAQAMLRFDMGDYSAAEELSRKALKILRTELGETHSSVAQIFNLQAGISHRRGDYPAAESSYRQALKIRQETLGEEHADVAETMNNLALLLHETGNFEAAEPLYRRALEIWRKVLGDENSSVGTALNNLALLHYDMGNYAAAEPLYRQALEIRKEALGEEHADVAQTLNNMGVMYKDMGDSKTAESLYRQALSIRRKALGEEHSDVAQTLNNLALLHQETGNFEAAEPLYRQALEIRKKALGEDHADVGQTLNNLAGLYYRNKDYPVAESLYRDALEIWRKALGDEHPDVAACANNLALLHYEKGDYTAAEPLYRQALRIWRKALGGEEHPNIGRVLNNLGALCVAIQRQDEAFELMKQAAEIEDCLIGQVFSIGSERQRAAIMEELQTRLSSFLSVVSHYFRDSSEAVRTALDLVLRRKAVGAEALAAQRDAVLGGEYPELLPKLQELTALRMKIAQKTLARPGPEGIDAYRKLLADWNAQKERLEAELARKIPEMNLEQKLRHVDRHVVAQALPENTALIEFVRFDVFDFQAVPARGESRSKPPRYLVFVIKAHQPDMVQMIDLGETEPIDRMIAAFRSFITSGKADRGTRDLGALPEAKKTLIAGEGNKLRASIFDPLLEALNGCKQLLIAPDGDLTRLPFEVLPTGDGRRLIEEYRISYLSTGRDALRFGAMSAIRPAEPMVVADPNFDLRKPMGPLQEKSHITPGRQSRDILRSGLSFMRLPGTRTEGEQVARMLGVEPRLEGDVLEAQIKKCRSPHIMHLATHGFFLADRERSPESNFRDLGAVGDQAGGGTGRLSVSGLENPLLRSGLALAGANTWLKQGELPSEAEDGILTAEDVSGMDLLATELVVLSACETGLGEVRAGEGVFGLRRSFILAGASTLVMSLWKVPDQPTQELMEDFYRRVLSGQPRAEALREAQLALSAKYPNPRDWGAFICQGDPNPLPS